MHKMPPPVLVAFHFGLDSLHILRMLSVHLLYRLVELFLQASLVLLVLIPHPLELIAQRLQLFARSRQLSVLHLDVAHIARVALEQQVANESVHLSLGAILDVRVQSAHTLRAVVVVAQHFAVGEAVDEIARHLFDPILTPEDLLVLALLLGSLLLARLSPFVEHQHGVEEKVGEDLPEERNGALNVSREPRIRAVEAQYEQVDFVKLSDVVDHVGYVLHVLGVAGRVRLTLGVEKAQLADAVECARG